MCEILGVAIVNLQSEDEIYQEELKYSFVEKFIGYLLKYKNDKATEKKNHDSCV